MWDALRIVKVVLDLWNSLRQPVRAAFVQPLITVLLLLALYTGWHVQDEGSLAAGLRVAFMDTRASRAQREHEVESAILRAELYQAAESDRLINQLLTALLHHAPRAARVRLGVIHNGVTGVTGLGLLRYDITNAVASAGHTPGQTMQNQPLSDWSTVLPRLLAGHCQLDQVATIDNLASRTQLQAMGAVAVVACPVTDINGTLLASVFVLWDVGDQCPSGEELAGLTEYAQRMGGQIAAALDLLVPLPRLGGAHGHRSD